MSAYSRDYYRRNPEACRGRTALYHLRLRRQVLEAYGGKCACCGESEPKFLTLDHVLGGGTAHRKASGSGLTVYSEVRRQGFPGTYQILCWNCNCAKGQHGQCPHEDL